MQYYSLFYIFYLYFIYLYNLFRAIDFGISLEGERDFFFNY